MEKLELQVLQASGINVHRRLEPFVSIHIETSRYVLKTLDQVSELREVLRLRSDIFCEEYGIDTAEKALDVDAYDFQCDHLIIIERESQTIVGTYRVLCSLFTTRFYSENEFELGEYLKTPGVKLELGRACIELEHRKGAVLNLLWRGIMQYAQKTKADSIFGCSSVKSESFSQAKALYLNLQLQNLISLQHRISPLKTYAIPDFSLVEPSECALELPPLFRSYLKAGARAYGPPAFDADFHCFDFLTILNLNEMSASLGKYNKI